MTIVIASLYGLLAAAITFCIAALAAAVGAQAFHLSNKEGWHGYFAALVGALAANFAFLATVTWTARSRGVTSLAAMLGHTLGSIVAVAGAGAVCVWLYWMVQPHVLPGPTPRLEFQVLAPPNANLPDAAQIEAELQTNRNKTPGRWNAGNELVDGHAVLAGNVELHDSTSQRLVVLKLPGRGVQLFRLRLPSNPTGEKYRRWSPWQKADFASGPDGAQPARSIRTQAFQIRYQVAMFGRP